MTRLLTVGHGAVPAEALAARLGGAGVEMVVDVRRFPGSRRHPHFGRDAMEGWLPEAGVAYRWDERLGGRRRGVPGSRHVALRDDAFRAYADHMCTQEFTVALDEVLADAAGRPTAVMCSEGLWWRCHRRLIADAAALLHGVDVRHVLPDGAVVAHVPTDGVRREGDGLVYDVGATPPLPG